jgi:heme exporter protein A
VQIARGKAVLRVRVLSLEREDQLLFSNLTFEIKPGSFLFVSGSNGSGKSSLLKVLAGLWLPTSGTLAWQNAPLRSEDPVFLSELLYIGHKTGIQPVLSPLQNLKWLLGLKQVPKSTLATIPEALEAFGLKEVIHSPSECLSQGQRQRVALAQLMLVSSKCWILDEPFSGLDESGKTLVTEIMKNHLAQGGLLIMASHDAFDCESHQKILLRLGI